MVVLPPGTQLQLMYLTKRIRQVPPGHFIEIGPGTGEITQLLMDHGWSGCSYDLDAITIANLNIRFAKEIAEQRFTPINDDYLAPRASEKADLIISCMVMEHLEDDAQLLFMHRSAELLNNGGIMIGLVPSSPAHWGIEDNVAGHCRRYTRTSVQELATVTGWKVHHIAGLTFPISNFLLPVSNYLVHRSERAKLGFSLLERTKQSGRRHVRFKTHFPSIIGILINKFTLLPIDLLQRLFAKSERALVLYFELESCAGANK